MSLPIRQAHPVEAYTKYVLPFNDGVAFDPTDLLKARAAKKDDLWTSKSGEKRFVYRPSQPDQPVSLLWGECSGFGARCSRSIIAVPRGLVKVWPRLGQGVDSRPIVLVHGILARNKGLEPASLVCHLKKKFSLRVFEENSSFWPRPSKTLRGLYREEFAKTFLLLDSQKPRTDSGVLMKRIIVRVGPRGRNWYGKWQPRLHFPFHNCQCNGGDLRTLAKWKSTTPHPFSRLFNKLDDNVHKVS